MQSLGRDICMNKMYDNINISSQLDSAIIKGIAKAKRNKLNKVMIAVASICICVVSVFGIINPAIAENVPIVSNVFEYLNSKASDKSMYNGGNQFKYSESVNKSAEDNGIEITINEAYCDGINAFLSYTLKSKKVIDKDCQNIYFLDVKTAIEGIDEENPMHNRNSEGELIDDHTYVGMMNFNLKDKAIAKIDEDGYINTKINISELFKGGNILDMGLFNNNYGNWDFELKISKDNINVKETYLGISQNGITLNKIVTTPASTVIEITSDNEFKEGTIIDAIDNDNKHIWWDNGSTSDDNKKQKWELKAIGDDVKSFRLIVFDKNSDEPKLAEFNINTSEIK